MTKEFVPYELAVKLKELGFDEPCFSTYNSDKKVSRNPSHNMEDLPIEGQPYYWQNSKIHVSCITAPTFSQSFRFFREKYNILATIYSNASGYLYEWHDAVGGTHRGWSEYEGPNDSGVWDTYEEAELACLVKLIEIVEQQKQK